MERERTYLCIDMKTFYASVECAERGLNPFETNLVVADLTRGKNALCLAITPQLKAMGIKNRCRISEIPSNVKYEVAPPRMRLYIEYAADIYAIFLRYFSAQDIHVYSIDESFIDITDYLKLYNMGARAMARLLIKEILEGKGILSCQDRFRYYRQAFKITYWLFDGGYLSGEVVETPSYYRFLADSTGNGSTII